MARGPLLLLLDFDGTLAPLAPSPARARMPGRTRRALRALARGGAALALVSGRGLKDLKAKAGLPGLVLVGNHGLSCGRRGLGFSSARAAAWRRQARRVLSRLAPLAASVPGCLLEDKGLDLSLHVRQVRPARRAALLEEAGALGAGMGMRVKMGKLALEFRPRGRRNKGWAVRRLAGGPLARGWRRSGLCLYVGDDRTDEDAFRALKGLGPRAFGVKVGGGSTAAGYRVEDPAEVARLLEWLVDIRGEAPR